MSSTSRDNNNDDIRDILVGLSAGVPSEWMDFFFDFLRRIIVGPREHFVRERIETFLTSSLMVTVDAAMGESIVRLHNIPVRRINDILGVIAEMRDARVPREIAGNNENDTGDFSDLTASHGALTASNGGGIRRVENVANLEALRGDTSRKSIAGGDSTVGFPLSRDNASTRT